MVDTQRLRSIIVLNDMTQTTVAKAIGMAPKTFYSKMKKKVFGSDEIEKMIELLSIDDPMAVFFVPNECPNKTH